MSFEGGAFGKDPESEQKSILGRASEIAQGLNHPVAAFFHLIFKSLALLVYMFGTWFSSSFVNLFVCCVLLLAFDFWTVKNVSGRLMVGLRWWSEIREDGTTTWKFEAREEGLTSTTLDIGVFWIGLFTPGVLWGLLAFGSLLRFNFEWLLLILTALSLSMANIVGYVRCKQDARSKIAAGLQGLVSRTGMNATMGRALQSAAGSAFGFGS
uniref:Golgi apparatus membrane protein TVP23 homolog n=1 Tax=Haptolina brevifila TaxID=156173 RepID=A0A7S2N7K1_9EUKA|mmetsp:Transcript_69044/g.136858  ORF Transcript_69044/g.136858 Transcript_69044/m.136858 type:complete len:211 (+) Transcript_69044:110-742(+)|eukprot:CAMPEP_0174739588 /NCGR_PEP_ID=MMETSP1094-20130205/71868_1 /TAXON_ID=156173 /ORGANISM="Chrysochromulina brevifilum, Strain UTEX LB 985" /LENGTH=210 /DNA_ID=CAMNT_0015943171 /DNA_START=106 /DNA_END=738 /DNA_ORIENTATION=+